MGSQQAECTEHNNEIILSVVELLEADVICVRVKSLIRCSSFVRSKMSGQIRKRSDCCEDMEKDNDVCARVYRTDSLLTVTLSEKLDHMQVRTTRFVQRYRFVLEHMMMLSTS